jgi:hypothetical protein
LFTLDLHATRVDHADDPPPDALDASSTHLPPTVSRGSAWALFCHGVQAAPQIEALSLANAGLHPPGLAVLAQALAHAPRIAFCDLHCNTFDTSVAKAFAALILHPSAHAEDGPVRPRGLLGLNLSTVASLRHVVGSTPPSPVPVSSGQCPLAQYPALLEAPEAADFPLTACCSCPWELQASTAEVPETVFPAWPPNAMLLLARALQRAPMPYFVMASPPSPRVAVDWTAAEEAATRLAAGPQLLLDAAAGVGAASVRLLVLVDSTAPPTKAALASTAPGIADYGPPHRSTREQTPPPVLPEPASPAADGPKPPRQADRRATLARFLDALISVLPPAAPGPVAFSSPLFADPALARDAPLCVACAARLAAWVRMLPRALVSQGRRAIEAHCRTAPSQQHPAQILAAAHPHLRLLARSFSALSPAPASTLLRASVAASACSLCPSADARWAAPLPLLALHLDANDDLVALATSGRVSASDAAVVKTAVHIPSYCRKLLGLDLQSSCSLDACECEGGALPSARELMAMPDCDGSSEQHDAMTSAAWLGEDAFISSWGSVLLPAARPPVLPRYRRRASLSFDVLSAYHEHLDSIGQWQ